MATNYELNEASSFLGIQLLGGFKVTLGHQVIDASAWRLRKARSLVKILALAPKHLLHREQILDLLWPDLNTTAAVNSLHQALFNARRILEPGQSQPSKYLRLENNTLSLCSVDQPYLVDVEAFETAATQAFKSHDTSLYQAAINLYTGDLLPEDQYESWVSLRQETLIQEYVNLLVALAEIYEAGNAYILAFGTFKQALIKDPLREDVHRGLMRVHCLCGNRQQALHQYQYLRKTLQDELEIEPDPQSQGLYQAILEGTFPLQSIRTVGLNPTNPVPPSFDSILHPSHSNHEPPLNNLPLELTSFIGREQEIIQVKQLFINSRLLTLTGAGGSGKTRLVLKVAGQFLSLPEFPEGIWLVELAPLFDSALLAHLVAGVLGVPEQPGSSMVETLVRYLKPRRLLLVLDNCEHLISACTRLVEQLLRACPHLKVLATSRESLHVPGELTWLVGSLSLPDPQHLPPLAEIESFAAIKLFTERARAVLSQFSLTENNAAYVAQICYKLDGLPLALELAAARLNLLSVEQIVKRLDDCFGLLTGGHHHSPTRQETLKLTLDWSYDLLNEDEQRLLRRLAVFAGNFNLEAAEVVCAGQGIEDGQIVDLLARLVDKSLVQVEDLAQVIRRESYPQVRYRLLEPVRQYVNKKLAGSGEMLVLRQKHCNWCLELAEQAEALLWDAGHVNWLSRLETEYDNLRAAMGWCIEMLRLDGANGPFLVKPASQPEPGTLSSLTPSVAGVRLARALWQFWLLRGLLNEGIWWLEDMLELAPNQNLDQAGAWLVAGRLRLRMGDLATSTNHIEKSLAIYQVLNDIVGGSQATHDLGIADFMQVGLTPAKARLAGGLKAARQGEFQLGCACITNALGVLAWWEGDFNSAKAFLNESLKELKESNDISGRFTSIINLGCTGVEPAGDSRLRIVVEDTLLIVRLFNSETAIGYVLANLGHMARTEGNLEQAQMFFEQSLDQFQKIGDLGGQGQVYGQLGNLALVEGDYSLAEKRLTESLAFRKKIGDRRGMGRTLGNLGNLAAVKGEYHQSSKILQEALVLFQEMGDKPGITQILDNLGSLALSQGEFSTARHLFEKTLSLHDEIAFFPWRPVDFLNLGMAAQLQGDNSVAQDYLEKAFNLFSHRGDWSKIINAPGFLKID